MNHRRILPALCACAALASSGCARTFIVVAAGPSERGESAPAEVLETDAYEPALPGLAAVAVRFPNDCWKFEKKAAGGAAQVVAHLTPACAPWGEALTQALQQAGFKVPALEDVVMLEAKQRMTPPAAAEWLGVNALIVVEKVDGSTAPLDAARRAKLLFTQSDPEGNLLGPVALKPRARKAIEELTGDCVRPWGAQAVEGVAEIRVTAVLPGSGAPMWRYARRATAPEAAPPGLQMLLRGRGRHWVPQLPEGLEPSGPPAVDPRLAEMAEWRLNNMLSSETWVPAAKPAVNLPALIRELSVELASRLASGT